MAPPKFDDLPKTANEVLNDDYQVSGHSFKAKQKTDFQGAVVTTAVDLFPAKESIMTPAKLTWRLPQPMGYKAVCIDKLELDKKGGVKMETTTDKVYPGLKITTKSDLNALKSSGMTYTYTGLKDFYISVDMKALKPEEFTADITWACCGPAILGIKFNPKNLTSPDVAGRYVKGPFFAALTAKDQFKTFTGVCHYKASPVLRCAMSYTYGGASNGAFALGASYEYGKNLLKGKVTKDSACIGVKTTIAKGLTKTSGLKYNFADGKTSYGVQLSVE